MGQMSQRSADWTSKLSPAFLSTNKTHVSVALNRDALLWIPKYFYAFFKSWEKFLGSERVPFWQICFKSILMHMVCVHAHIKKNTFRNIKSGRWSLWLFIREKQLSLAQLENWEISNQPEALPKKDNLYLGWFSCLIYPSWGRQICLPVWWACLYVITNFFSTLIIPLLLSLIGFFSHF